MSLFDAGQQGLWTTLNRNYSMLNQLMRFSYIYLNRDKVEQCLSYQTWSRQGRNTVVYQKDSHLNPSHT